MKKNLGVALTSSLIFWAFSVSLLAWGWWSLDQTIKFSVSASAPNIGIFIGIVVQLGQNFAVWMKNQSQSGNIRLLCWLGFFVCAVLDAATNIGEYRKLYIGTEPLSLWFGYALCVVVVFVEEVLAYSLAAALASTNDLIEVLGGSRLQALEVAAHGAGQFQMRRQKVHAQAATPLPPVDLWGQQSSP